MFITLQEEDGRPVRVNRDWVELYYEDEDGMAIVYMHNDDIGLKTTLSVKDLHILFKADGLGI